MHEWLKSLEILLLYGNPLLTFPKSIRFTKNLKYLNLDETQITSLNNTGLNENPKLEKLYLTKTALKFIDDCAFCNYPNLKNLQIYQNYNLTFIHENAFGYAYNGTSPALESFSIEYCNLKTIPENLLNWNKIAKFGLGNNPFICNCSMAWLINDILSPTHTMNLQKVAQHPFISYPTEVMEVMEMGLPHMSLDLSEPQYNMVQQLPYPSFAAEGIVQQQSAPYMDDGLRCFGPHALKYVKFIDISRNFCPYETKVEQQKCKEYNKLVAESSSMAFSWIHIGVAAVILIFGFFIGAVTFPLGRYLFRHRKQDYGFKNFAFTDYKAPEDFDEERNRNNV
uniref:Uncharacterized protein n=1 Tax=Panagrolaimus davidi TaxID=227884 RepID=A0A914PAA4_9BILA